MPRRRELPHDPQGAVYRDGTVRSTTNDEVVVPYWDLMQYDRPLNPYDALMRCAPGEEPEPSQLETLALREVVTAAIDGLTRDEAWLFNACVVERRSLRQLERMTSIPKTTLARKRDAILAKLRDQLSGHPLVEAHLTHTTPPQEDTT